MSDQHPDQLPESNRANGKGELYPEQRAEAMASDVATPAPFVPLGDTGIPAEQESSVPDWEWEKFPQPRGWSLQWDGSSIQAIQRFNTWFEAPLDTIVETDTPPLHED